MSIESNAFYRRAVGRLIVGIRAANGIDQSELAKELGIKQSGVSRIENGLQVPTLDQVLKLAKLFKLSPNDILLWSDEK